MLRNFDNYRTLSDEDFVRMLTSENANEELQEFFIRKKCSKIIEYISRNIYQSSTPNYIIGEFYEFLSNDNWTLLKSWKKKNGASLISYIARCSTNYFLHEAAKEKKRREEVITTGCTPGFLESLGDIADEEPANDIPVWQAYKMLNERDQAILQLLVIEEKNTLDAAPLIWKYIKSQQNYDEIPAKRVQCTISMAKHRAQTALLNNIQRLSN